MAQCEINYIASNIKVCLYEYLKKKIASLTRECNKIFYFFYDIFMPVN